MHLHWIEATASWNLHHDKIWLEAAIVMSANFITKVHKVTVQLKFTLRHVLAVRNCIPSTDWLQQNATRNKRLSLHLFNPRISAHCNFALEIVTKKDVLMFSLYSFFVKVIYIFHLYQKWWPSHHSGSSPGLVVVVFTAVFVCNSLLSTQIYQYVCTKCHSVLLNVIGKLCANFWTLHETQ